MDATNTRILASVQRWLQYGHPLPRRVRVLAVAAHSWSGPFGHFHQIFFLDPATMSAGPRSSFLVGCHSFAISGNRLAKLLVTETCRPAQHGHPFPLVRLYSLACHSWSGPLGHFHQIFFTDPAAMSAGRRSLFLVGCQCAAISGWVIERGCFDLDIGITGNIISSLAAGGGSSGALLNASQNVPAEATGRPPTQDPGNPQGA